MSKLPPVKNGELLRKHSLMLFNLRRMSIRPCWTSTIWQLPTMMPTSLTSWNQNSSRNKWTPSNPWQICSRMFAELAKAWVSLFSTRNSNLKLLARAYFKLPAGV
uniref:Uncharacterized protein n=1 Tax=Cacopsylla melanoneura TaxID=428564 RepID=A0A8D8ZGY7_9HEMI